MARAMQLGVLRTRLVLREASDADLAEDADFEERTMRQTAMLDTFRISRVYRIKRRGRQRKRVLEQSGEILERQLQQVRKRLSRLKED